MSMKKRRAWPWWFAACVLGALFFGYQGNSKFGPATADREVVITTRIETLVVGDLVWAENPTGEVDYTLGLEVEPEAWRRLKLVAPKRAGGWAYVELLRPMWWLEERNAQVGGRIDINVPECGIDGYAKLLYIGACTPIELDPTCHRRVITGTFHHHAADILDLRLANLSEPIGTTPAHPFWSEVRQDFITAGNSTPEKPSGYSAAQRASPASPLALRQKRCTTSKCTWTTSTT